MRRAGLLLALEEELEVDGGPRAGRLERVERRRDREDRGLVVGRRAREDPPLPAQRAAQRREVERRARPGRAARRGARASTAGSPSARARRAGRRSARRGPRSSARPPAARRRRRAARPGHRGGGRRSPASRACRRCARRCGGFPRRRRPRWAGPGARRTPAAAPAGGPGRGRARARGGPRGAAAAGWASAAPTRATRQARGTLRSWPDYAPGSACLPPNPPNRLRLCRTPPSKPYPPLRHLKVRRVVMEGLAGVASGDARVLMSEDHDRRAAEMRLVRAAQQGDLLAFERLYRDNERKVFGLCFRLSSDPALAEELTQEVFVRAWRKLVELPRRERLLVLALPADGERGAERAPLAAPPRRADRGDRGPGAPRADAARARARGGLRPREGDRDAAARGAGRVRAPRRRGPDPRGDRRRC